MVSIRILQYNRTSIWLHGISGSNTLLNALVRTSIVHTTVYHCIKLLINTFIRWKEQLAYKDINWLKANLLRSTLLLNRTRKNMWLNTLSTPCVADPAHSHSKMWRTVELFVVENWNLVTFSEKCSAICPCLFYEVWFCNFWDIIIFSDFYSLLPPWTHWSISFSFNSSRSTNSINCSLVFSSRSQLIFQAIKHSGGAA